MNSLTKSERLHSFGAIRRLFKEGRSGFVYPFRYMVYTEEAPQTEVALLFSTPKKYHKRAKKRNALRRRMREAYRLNKSLIVEAAPNLRVELAIVYSTKTVHDYKTIENGVKRVLQQVAQSL